MSNINGNWRQTQNSSGNISGDSCGPFIGRDVTQRYNSRSTYSSSSRQATGPVGAFPTNVPNIPFFEDDHIAGISLERDSNLAAQVKNELDRINHSPQGFQGFPVTCTPQLSESDIQKLKERPYLITPKPEGVHYLLYINKYGRMFLENRANHIFKVDHYCAPQLIPKNTVLDGIVTRKIIGDGAIQNNNAGKLTFLVMDATRCSGVDLTQKSIQQRISTIQSKIMEPRLEGIACRSISVEREVFDLVITNYEDPSLVMEEYLQDEFEARYEYPLRSFIFHPSDGKYLVGYREKIFQWKENSVQKFCFRLQISDERESTTADLLGLKPGKEPKGEGKYCTIDLTDEMRNMNGCLIECCYVDHHWCFVRKRTDRDHPNGKKAFQRKMRATENPVTRKTLLGCFEV